MRTAAESPVPTPVRGEVAPGFEPVREAFAANFEDAAEVGAACAVYHRGRLVVDLWGGVRDPASGAAWERETLVGWFSVTKAISAMAMALLHSRGLLDYDQRVAHYWPEFAQNGKGGITVRQLLAHQAGLSAIDTPLTPELLADHDAMAELLARQCPAWEPGAFQGYHAVTLGYFESALLRRIDPLRRTIGRFVRDEITDPLGVEFYIGTPQSIPDERIAEIQDFRVHELLYRPVGIPMRLILAVLNPWSLPARSFLNPKVGRPNELFKPPLRGVELPSSNGLGTARAVARMFGVFAAGGGELGVEPRTIEALEAPARVPPGGERDLILKAECRYGLGFAKPFPTFPFGTSDRAYGAAGLGGSAGLADPATGIGYAFVPSRSGFYLWNDPRERRVREAVYGCVAEVA